MCHAQDIKNEIEIINEILGCEENTRELAILVRNNWQADFIKSHALKLPHGRVMTMHASKGLEFDAVIVAGISDRVIPDKLSDIEEERRLFYVAMSRARERLYIIGHVNDDGSPARFVRELGMR